MGDKYSIMDDDGERILKEIAECREDERSGQGMQLQMIGIAAAMLGVILTVVITKKAELKEYLWLISLLSDLIFFVVFSFMSHLGVQNYIRYYYLRDLEYQYGKVKKKKTETTETTSPVFLNWNMTSAPVTTLNIKQIKSPRALAAYVSYVGAAFLAVVFCCLATGVIFYNVEHDAKWKYALIGVIVLAVVSIGELLVLVTGSTSAKDFYVWAKSRATERVKSGRDNYEVEKMDDTRINKEEYKKELKRGIMYYIYPKIQDPQKLFLIPFGTFFALTFISKDLADMVTNFKSIFPCFIFVYILIELFLYPARYQINDIRGVVGDEEEIKACNKINNGDKDNCFPKERWGLPRIEKYKNCPADEFSTRDDEEWKKKDVKRSVNVAIIKLVIGVAAIAYTFLPDNLMESFEGFKTFRCWILFGALALLVVTYIYEALRTSLEIEKEKISKIKIFWLFFFVGFGYALRFSFGFFAVRFVWNSISIPAFIGMYLYGIMSVMLMWMFRAHKEYEGKKKSDDFSKAYYKWIYDEWGEYYYIINPKMEKGCKQLFSAMWNLLLLLIYIVLLIATLSSRDIHALIATLLSIDIHALVATLLSMDIHALVVIGMVLVMVLVPVLSWLFITVWVDKVKAFFIVLSVVHVIFFVISLFFAPMQFIGYMSYLCLVVATYTSLGYTMGGSLTEFIEGEKTKEWVSHKSNKDE